MAPISPQRAASETASPSSPVHADRSFATHVTANLTEDEDHDGANGTPRTTGRAGDTPARPPRAGRARGGRESGAAGGSGLFKDPSSIGKVRHLKKEDGEPLWRADIQYDFLRAIFDDNHKVFTNSYEPDTIGKQCFADLYIDTMARSSKTSKILHDKLLSDREAAKNMAMVCLLVNIGRMNTTLNFFPEMRAQLRTYHAIPALQLNERATDYKQLQDAPRLKSILKGGTEDRNEPRSLDALKDMEPPRTNPVNLLFLICNNASKVAELHFPPGFEFHDLIMKSEWTSQSRANAFLWIVWFYLESDFTEEGCEENPFGPGVDYGVDVANQGVPEAIVMTPEEQAQENVDTPEEREFGLVKKQLRARILSDDKFIEMPAHKRNSRPSRPSAAAAAAAVALAAKEDAVAEAVDAATDTERAAPPAILPRIRPSKHESDLESARSTPPPRSLIRSLAGGGPGSAGGAKRSGALKYQLVDGSSPARQPPLIQQLHQQQQQQQQTRKKRKQPRADRSGRHHDDDDDDDMGMGASTAPGRKPRPPTAHQIAVENNRKQRIEYLLSRGIHRKHHRARKVRRTEGAIIRALRRLDDVDDPFQDSEDEDSLAFNRSLFSLQPGAPPNMHTNTPFRERGFYGLVQLDTEADDFGEEIASYAAAMRRACRRVNRWETDGKNNHAVVPTIKRPRINVATADDEFRDPNETEEEQDFDANDADMSVTMPIVDTTLVTGAKRRRPTGGASRARGGAGRVAKGGASASTGNRRRRPAATAAAATNGTNGDVTMDDADEGEVPFKVKREEDDDDEVDEAEADDGEDDEEADGDAAAEGGEDEEDELNDMDKTLLGMGEGDSESD